MAQMFFGIPGSHMQWVPCPLIDSTVQRNRYLERLQFENGGGDVRRSQQYQLQYNFNMNGPAHELEGIDAFNRFASGFYGDGLIHLAYPTNFETNMLPAVWASPGLIEQGWKNICANTPTFADTASNAYNQPARTATWNITTDAGVFTKKATIVIPPTHTLHIGASGSSTGDGGVFVRPRNTSGIIGSPTELTLLDATAATRTNATFAGSSYQAVDVYVARSAATTSTVTLTSMIAQLYKTGITPQIPSHHIMGEGATGLEFIDDAIVETYSYMYPPRKGIATSLVEVEAWR